MKDGPAFSLTVCMTPYKDNETTHRLPKAGYEQIPMYEKATNFQLKSYARGSIEAKAILEIAALRKAPIKIFVQFADVLRTKVVCCGNAYSKEHT